jgi:hypothetical protein
MSPMHSLVLGDVESLVNRQDRRDVWVILFWHTPLCRAGAHDGCSCCISLHSCEPRWPAMRTFAASVCVHGVVMAQLSARTKTCVYSIVLHWCCTSGQSVLLCD